MRWHKREASTASIRELSERYGVDLLHASILARRGIVAPEEILYYLEDDARYLRNPFLFGAMEDAVDRILLARDEGEKVLVFGDRDVDGMTSTVIMHEALAALGLDVRFRLPSEDEKYGLTSKVVEEFAADFGSLVVTVDCGISNHAEVLRARELGVDVIIVDHHNLQAPAPPEALAVIDPKLADSGYPFRDLAGCGVAYKVAWALKFAVTELYKQDIALLNVRPANDAYIVEAVRLSNLVETGRLTETIVPGMVELDRTRLVPFLADRQIFVWDGDLQRKLLAKALGRAADVQFHDIAPDVARTMPQTAGQSLLRLAEKSRIARYSDESRNDRARAELDVFANVFVSFVLKSVDYFNSGDLETLQLVALGTIADLMPLRDENRILVRQGLAALSKKPRSGLAELVAKQNLAGRRLGAVEVSWQITPVLNAAGRMGEPATAVSLLLSKDLAERGSLSERLAGLNQERRRLGTECWEILYPGARESLERHGGKLVVMGSEAVHRGITGIIASRMADTFKAPAIVASFMKDGTLAGSIRSVRGFNVKALLERGADLFHDYGGHDAAAGFSMDIARWPEFLSRMEASAGSIELASEEERVEIDAELPHDYMRPELMELADRFEPYGEASEPLVFLARDVPLVQADVVGKQDKNHLKLVLDFGKHKWPALFWGGAERYGRDFSVGDRLDVVFRLQKNYWNGVEQPQLVLVDARRAGA